MHKQNLHMTHTKNLWKNHIMCFRISNHQKNLKTWFLSSIPNPQNISKLIHKWNGCELKHGYLY
jgi:hypothetical protein